MTCAQRGTNDLAAPSPQPAPKKIGTLGDMIRRRRGVRSARTEWACPWGFLHVVPAEIHGLYLHPRRRAKALPALLDGAKGAKRPSCALEFLKGELACHTVLTVPAGFVEGNA